jgi:hypothetical protein
MTIVHGLLHIPKNIHYCTPSWATWKFHIEWMSCDFQGHLGSKSAPASNINTRVLHGAYLDQLSNRFNMSNELSKVGKKPKGVLSQNETIKGGCKCNQPYFVLIYLIDYLSDKDYIL